MGQEEIIKEDIMVKEEEGAPSDKEKEKQKEQEHRDTDNGEEKCFLVKTSFSYWLMCFCK